MSRGDIGLPEKKCSKCEVVKPLDEFSKRKDAPDGHRADCLACRTKWRQDNKEYLAEYNKQYKQEHKEEAAEYNKQYKHGYRAIRNERRNKRRQNDVEYRLGCIVGTSISRALTKNDGSKEGESTFQYLPYTKKDMKKHIEKQFEPWMNWDNHGEWHIDHIIPQSLLPYDTMTHPNFQKCWALENLQPLEAKENMSKGNRLYEREEA